MHSLYLYICRARAIDNIDILDAHQSMPDVKNTLSRLLKTMGARMKKKMSRMERSILFEG